MGIDIGGTGLKAALVDERGQIVHHVETPTRAFEGANAILERVEQLARLLMNRPGPPVLGVGVGSAGRIDHRRGYVVFASGNLPGWTGLHLGDELSSRLSLPVVVDNDVNAAATAEGWIGAARGTADYVMLTIGTGVGAAVVLGRKTWRGSRWGAGEVGHMTLYPHGLACNCGGTGCAEMYVSAKALTRRSNEFLKGGRPFRGIRDVLAAAERGQGERTEAARAGVKAWTADLALVLVNLQQSFDPQIVVIGGGIVRLGYWWDRMLEVVAHEGQARSLAMRVRRAHLGPQAGVVGAARLAMLAKEQGQKASIPGIRSKSPAAEAAAAQLGPLGPIIRRAEG